MTTAESIAHAIWPHYDAAVLALSGRFNRVREALDGRVLLDPAALPIAAILRNHDETPCPAFAIVRHLADLIEAQTTPPVEEPTGLGAVVRDGDDRLWVKSATCSSSWEPTDDTCYKVWSDLPRPVEVLSAGWDGDR